MIIFFISVLWAAEIKICTDATASNELSWIDITEFKKRDCKEEEEPANITDLEIQFSNSFKNLKTEHKDDLLDISKHFNAFYNPRKIAYYFGDSFKKGKMAEYHQAVKDHVESTITVSTKTQQSLKAFSSKLKIAVITFAGLFFTSFVGILGMIIYRDKKENESIEEINEAAINGAEVLSEQIAKLQVEGSSTNSDALKEIKSKLNTYEKGYARCKKDNARLDSENKQKSEEIVQLQKNLEQLRNRAKNQKPASKKTTSKQSLESFTPDKTDPNILSEKDTRALVNNLMKLNQILPKEPHKNPEGVHEFKRGLQLLNKKLSDGSIQTVDINNVYIFFLHFVFRKDHEWFKNHQETINLVNRMFKKLRLIDSNPTAIFEGKITRNDQGQYLLEGKPIHIQASNTEYFETADDMTEIKKFELKGIYWEVYNDQLQLKTLKLKSLSQWHLRFQ